MISRILTGLFCFFLFSAQSQVLRDINYNYQYNPNGLFNFTWKCIKESNTYNVFYEVILSDTTFKDYHVQFETRQSISEKTSSIVSTAQGGKGKISFNDSGQKIVVAKISFLENGKPKSYIFYKSLPKNKSITFLRKTRS